MNRLRPPLANEGIHGDPALKAAIAARERVVDEYHKAKVPVPDRYSPFGESTFDIDTRPTTPTYSGRAT